jgi:phosphoglycerol transferase MdoB-like AlkP superfamily enzyme
MRQFFRDKVSVPEHLRYIITVYILGILFFTVFRFALFLVNLKYLKNLTENKFSLLLKAFFMGFRFDTVISGYILVVPFILLSGASLFLNRNKVIYKLVTVYLGVAYTLAFAICIMDIPYFIHYFSRLSYAILIWKDTPSFMFNMVFQEIGYWIYIIPFLISCVLLWYILIRLYKKNTSPVPLNEKLSSRVHYFKVAGFSLLVLVILFIGIRGRVSIKSPIRVGTAYFSNHAFINQLGLNPVFTFVRSALDTLGSANREFKYWSDDEVIRRAKKYLKIPANSSFDSPIAREVQTSGHPLKANIILIIMESMAAVNMERFGNSNGLTPNLDRLAKQGYSFDKIYTSGVHTYSGIYSTLFSFPVELNKHPMDSVLMLRYTGFSNTLKKHGYQTIYFTTHDDQFDNVGGFLKANNFNQIISEKDYPSNQILSTLGIPDHRMFEFSIPKLNKLNQNQNPFFATFMTSSNHKPFHIPRNIPFKPRSIKKSQRIVEYADWSIGHFMEMAAHQEWFKNTIFVFIADSGSYYKSTYDMPLSFHHTPFIIYAPSMITEAKVFDKIGGQIDVFPTVMGLLNISYINNTLGIDLLREERPFIFFCSDDKIGCLNHSYFLVVRDQKNESLYRYKNGNTRDYIKIKKKLRKRMRKYLFTMLQITTWMIKHRKVGDLSDSNRKMASQ